MPRVDLASLPPPEATCFSCDRIVLLDRRARRAGRFRCPHCHADNRVGADGQGRMLGAQGERLEAMARAWCNCGVENRLPRGLIRAGRFTCWQCGEVRPVPRALRRGTGRGARLGSGFVIALLLGSLGWSGQRIWQSFGGATAAGAETVTAPYNADEALRLEQVRPLPPTADGLSYEFTVRVFNGLDRPLTYYVQTGIYQGLVPVASTIRAVRLLRPGEARRISVRVLDRRRLQADQAQVQIIGVS